MLKDIFTLVTLPVLAYETVETVKNFNQSLAAQLWGIAWISILFGLWFGLIFSQEIWNIYSRKKIGLLFPATILASITVPLLGLRLGVGLTAIGFITFWTVARAVESMISGGWHKSQHPYSPRRT